MPHPEGLSAITVGVLALRQVSPIGQPTPRLPSLSQGRQGARSGVAKPGELAARLLQPDCGAEPEHGPPGPGMLMPDQLRRGQSRPGNPPGCSGLLPGVYQDGVDMEERDAGAAGSGDPRWFRLLMVSIPPTIAAIAGCIGYFAQ